jgi:hypothetical protein
MWAPLTVQDEYKEAGSFPQQLRNFSVYKNRSPLKTRSKIKSNTYHGDTEPLRKHGENRVAPRRRGDAEKTKVAGVALGFGFGFGFGFDF